MLLGRERPRVCPPLPLHGPWKAAVADAREISYEYFPWQVVDLRYIEATGPDGKKLYPEVATIVSRQNGKTDPLVPHIRRRLLSGRRIMHTAQNRELPRDVFGRVADVFMEHHRDLLRSKPRFANGQEEIRLKNGGIYSIVAPTRSGARGPSRDDLIIDEVRELDDWAFIAAAKPTLAASKDPQILYRSNAGDDSSVVLNALRARSVEDPSLAYLEWSAAPERASDDVEGWLESNPAIGHLPGLLENLEREHRAHRLAGTMAIFETEHLCRWVATMRARLVDEFLWRDAAVSELGKPRRPFMAVSMDPSGTRASVAIAWRLPDETIGLRMLPEAVGSPIDTDAFGKHLRDEAMRMGVPVVGGDPMTDKALLRWFRKAQPISGQEWLNASARFVTALEAKRIRWIDCEAVTEDLIWTARKEGSSPGTFEAVRAKDDMPITAALAAVRAVWLASELTMTVPTGF